MPNGEETARLLARTEVFAGLEPRELPAIAQVAVPRHWDRGEVIFREGDTGRHLLPAALRRGRAHPRAPGRPHGRARRAARRRAVRRAGDVPRRDPLGHRRGDRALHARWRCWPATSSACVRRNPDLALKLLATLAERVSRTNERLLQQSFQTVAGRVASALLAQTVSRQAEGAPEEDVLIRATQAEIAHLAGTSRESASRFLATLERAGVVTLGRGKVTVHDPGRLRNYIH